MTIRLFIAPAAAGKTAACLDRVRAVSRQRPLVPVWVCLPNGAQVAAFRRRLAAAGGALGVHVGTFHALYGEILLAAGEPVAELGQALQYRLLRALVDDAAAGGELRHYATLRDKPGFIRVLHRTISEVKRAHVDPERLRAAVAGQGRRLEELAHLYAAYQQRLLERRWLDGEELAWRAIARLAGQPGLCAGWAFLAVDGFDHLDPVQVDFLDELARQVPELWITLTYGPQAGRLAHRRFERTVTELGAGDWGLGVRAEGLPGGTGVACGHLAPAIGHLEANLFGPAVGAGEPAGAVEWLEAPNPALEVRAALRWLKERLVCDGLACDEVAVLARDLTSYAPLLLETAEEFGIPLHLAQGLPLGRNPAVAALLGLLALPRRDRGSAALPDGRFPTRPVLDALRSPYFAWQSCEVEGEPLGLTAADVDLLERAALAGQVLGGCAQWAEALALQSERVQAEGEAEELGEVPDPDRDAPRERWIEVRARWERLLVRITPPVEETVAGYTAWVEDLIGDDPGATGRTAGQDQASLHMPVCARGGAAALCKRDIEALRALKEALRGLVWAEAALDTGERISYERFVDELQGVIDATSYGAAEHSPVGEVLAADVAAARGLSFRAVALLGLSEGIFPCPPAEDPLLRDSDRARLLERGLPLKGPVAGADFTLFYEAVTRARERLLLARPYLGADGQPWDPSPFWEETLRLFGAQEPAERERLVTRVRSADALPLEQAASWPELLAALSQKVQAGDEGAKALAGQAGIAALWQGVEQGAAVLGARLQRGASGPFEGDCSAGRALWSERYGPERAWSVSRLEAYLTCPLRFYLSSALELEPRPEPVAGFDAAQLGTICHAILEQVYRQVPTGESEGLLAALPAVAAEVLERAPRENGFRPGPLWEQEKAGIRQDVERTLRALAEQGEGWRVVGLELRFGIGDEGAPAQWIETEQGGRFLLHGIVDRVDGNAQGELRLIDYKTGSAQIRYQDLLEGRRIQLALYARVAPRVLGGGEVTAGFYWHIRKAGRSVLTLEGFEGGAAGAAKLAAERAWEAVQGVRAGRFVPQAQAQGCPGYCPGAGFCWRCVAGRR